MTTTAQEFFDAVDNLTERITYFENWMLETRHRLAGVVKVDGLTISTARFKSKWRVMVEAEGYERKPAADASIEVKTIVLLNLRALHQDMMSRVAKNTADIYAAIETADEFFDSLEY